MVSISYVLDLFKVFKMKYDITVYSSEECQYCVRLKESLEENNITYTNEEHIKGV